MTQRAYRNLLTGVTVLAMALLALVMLDRPALAEDVAPVAPDASVGSWGILPVQAK
ncbi:hypothetical protein BH09ACT12_BH09ACT12_19730 [soil metagenome]